MKILTMKIETFEGIINSASEVLLAMDYKGKLILFCFSITSEVLCIYYYVSAMDPKGEVEGYVVLEDDNFKIVKHPKANAITSIVSVESSPVIERIFQREEKAGRI